GGAAFVATMAISSSALAETCSPCEDGKRFCGTYESQTGTWLEGEWQSCPLYTCSACVQGQMFCGVLDREISQWLGGEWYDCGIQFSRLPYYYYNGIYFRPGIRPLYRPLLRYGYRPAYRPGFRPIVRPGRPG